jgi:hypothetical protein
LSDTTTSDDDLADAIDDAPELATDDTATGPSRGRVPAGRRRSATTNRWMRWLHVYTSMISFVVVLFFGLTGLTLNHPTWTFGDPPTTTTHTGQLPTSYKSSDGKVDFLAISEFVRNSYGVRGAVSEYGTQANQGTISYKSAGYAANLFFTVDTGTFKLTVEEAGLVGVMNDLHKGRDTTSSWKWLIDASAILLVLVSVTGLGIQIFQRKRRTRAIIFAVIGGVIAIVMVWLATR